LAEFEEPHDYLRGWHGDPGALDQSGNAAGSAVRSVINGLELPGTT